MSEPQTETDADPTPGPWTNGHGGNPKASETCKVKQANVSAGGAVADVNMARPQKENLANARLIANAGSAAQEAREMGYDPVAAVGALPKLMEATESGGPVSDALCALKQAADFIEHETDSRLGAGRLRRLADEAAESVGLEIKVASNSAEGSGE